MNERWFDKNVPEGWEVTRLKNVVNYVKNGIWGDDPNGDEADIECVRIADFDRQKNVIKNRSLTLRNIDKAQVARYLLKQGDLLIEKSGGGDKQPVGFVVQYNLDKKAVYANFMARIDLKLDKVNSSFMNFVFSALYYVKANLKAFNQTTGIQNLNSTVYLNEIFTYPKLEVQVKIKNYLKLKTKEIDNLIKAKETLIKMLQQQRQSIITEAVTKGLNPNVKMKDSGVEWIGEIPENWSVKKVKYLISEPLSYGANESAELDDRELPRYIRITDIDDSGKLRESTFKSISKEIANLYNVKNGDILLARSGATVGKSYFHRESESASHAGYLIKLRAKNYKIGEYIYLYTQSTIYSQWINSNLIQATIQNVSAEKYANLYVSIPDRIEEVELIVNNIKHRSDEINSLIQKIKIEIILIKEYRQSLIYEAVTGKIDVREMELEEVR